MLVYVGVGIAYIFVVAQSHNTLYKALEESSMH